MILAIDGMGGDNAPGAVVAGAVEAARSLRARIWIYGEEARLKRELAAHSYDKEQIHIVPCSETITGEDNPIRAVRSKKDSSMVRAVMDVKEGKVDAFVSGGNTGALITASALLLGRIRGLYRPALTTPIPTDRGVAVLLDVGANAECKSEYLQQFAVMGAFYAQKVCDIAQPKVGLVNIGTEAGKGNELTKKAYDLLSRQSGMPFIGNIEARRVPHGDADVIVTDGFTGNVILKLMEGTAEVLFGNVKQAFFQNWKGKLGALLVKSGLMGLKKKMDYTEYGGAPVLGVNGIVVKAHGSSDKNAFCHALQRAAKFVESGVMQDIKQYFEQQGAPEEATKE